MKNIYSFDNNCNTHSILCSHRSQTVKIYSSNQDECFDHVVFITTVFNGTMVCTIHFLTAMKIVIAQYPEVLKIQHDPDNVNRFKSYPIFCPRIDVSAIQRHCF